MILSQMPIEESGEIKVRTDCLNFDVFLSSVYKLKNKFQLEEEGTGIIFLGILDPAAVQDRTKFPSLNNNAHLQL